MAKVKACNINILETATVTLTAGTEDASFPLYRLYDRELENSFKTTIAETFEVKVDQGSDVKSIDRLLIPAGHNLNGVTLTLSYSDDDVTYVNARQWVQSGNDIIDEYISLMAHKFWKFHGLTPAAIPVIHELFLTSTYEFEENPSMPAGPQDPVFNVENAITSGGNDRFIKHGPPKKQRNYNLYKIGNTQQSNLEILNDAWDGCNPFFFCDHNGVWFFCKLTQPISLKLEDENESDELYSAIFNVLEVL